MRTARLKWTMLVSVVAVMLMVASIIGPAGAQQGAAPARVVLPTDRTVLPIPEPQYPHSTVFNARNATPPPRFEVKAPAKAPTETGKRSLNLRIDEDSYRRLSVHALMRNATISSLVEGYAQSLKEFSIHRNAARSEQGE